MRRIHTQSRRVLRNRSRRAFSLVEMLIALSVTAALLTSVLAALDASFRAYRATTEASAQQTVARLVMHRILSLLRTGSEFGPYPVNVITTPTIRSDYVEFIAADGEVLRIEYNPDDEVLYLIVDPGGAGEDVQVLIAGVQPQYDAANERIPPFALHYIVGPKLHRASVDLTVVDDPDVVLTLEGDEVVPFRLVGSVMPRNNL